MMESALLVWSVNWLPLVASCRAQEAALAPELMEDFLLEAQSRGAASPPDGNGDDWPDAAGEGGGGDWDERGRWYPDDSKSGLPGAGLLRAQEQQSPLVLHHQHTLPSVGSRCGYRHVLGAL